MKWRPTS